MTRWLKASSEIQKKCEEHESHYRTFEYNDDTEFKNDFGRHNYIVAENETIETISENGISDEEFESKRKKLADFVQSEQLTQLLLSKGGQSRLSQLSKLQMLYFCYQGQKVAPMGRASLCNYFKSDGEVYHIACSLIYTMTCDQKFYVMHPVNKKLFEISDVELVLINDIVNSVDQRIIKFFGEALQSISLDKIRKSQTLDGHLVANAISYFYKNLAKLRLMSLLEFVKDMFEQLVQIEFIEKMIKLQSEYSEANFKNRLSFLDERIRIADAGLPALQAERKKLDQKKLELESKINFLKIFAENSCIPFMSTADLVKYEKSWVHLAVKKPPKEEFDRIIEKWSDAHKLGDLLFIFSHKKNQWCAVRKNAAEREEKCQLVVLSETTKFAQALKAIEEGTDTEDFDVNGTVVDLSQLRDLLLETSPFKDRRGHNTRALHQIGIAFSLQANDVVSSLPVQELDGAEMAEVEAMSKSQTPIMRALAEARGNLQARMNLMELPLQEEAKSPREPRKSPIIDRLRNLSVMIKRRSRSASVDSELQNDSVGIGNELKNK